MPAVCKVRTMRAKARAMISSCASAASKCRARSKGEVAEKRAGGSKAFRSAAGSCKTSRMASIEPYF